MKVTRVPLRTVCSLWPLFVLDICSWPDTSSKMKSRTRIESFCQGSDGKEWNGMAVWVPNNVRCMAVSVSRWDKLKDLHMLFCFILLVIGNSHWLKTSSHIAVGVHCSSLLLIVFDIFSANHQHKNKKKRFCVGGTTKFLSSLCWCPSQQQFSI